MKRPRRAAKKTVRKPARKRVVKRLTRKQRIAKIERDADKPRRFVDQFHLSERLVPVGWGYQWKVYGDEYRPGWTPVPYSRHAHDFPRSANLNGQIVIDGLILMEALKDQIVSELYAAQRAAVEMDAQFKANLGMEGRRSEIGFSYPLLPESEVLTKVLEGAPPEIGPDIDVPISLLIRVPARWASAAAYLSLTISEYTRRRIVGERMILGSMDERDGDLDAVYQPVILKFSPSKEG